MIKKVAIFLICQLYITPIYSQSSSIGVVLSTPDIVNGNYDKKFRSTDYRIGSTGYSIEYSVQIGQRLLFNSDIGYTSVEENYDSEGYLKQQASIFNTGPFILKDKNTNFLTFAFGSRYYFKELFKWFYIDAKLKSFLFLNGSEKSTIRQTISSKPNVEYDSTEDNFNSFTPTLKIGVGIEFPILTNYGLFVELGRTFKSHSFYVDQTNISYIFKENAIGFRYKFLKKNYARIN